MKFQDGKLTSMGELPNGDLLIVLTSDGWYYRNELEDSKWGLNELLDAFVCNGWAFTDDVSWWGHLSTAPAITDSWEYKYPESETGDLDELNMPYFWYYDEYQIKDPVKVLFEQGYIVWKKFYVQ